MAMSSQEKQAAYRERLRAKGMRQILVNIDELDYASGFTAAKTGVECPTPEGRDPMSWLAGYLAGAKGPKTDE